MIVWTLENFMTQFPCWFFRSAIKWSRSQGNHVVLAETSMTRFNVLHIKHIIHISTNTDNGGKSIVCMCILCVQIVCFWGENKCLEKKNTLHRLCYFLTLSVLFPCSQDSSSLHHTTGCFCTITRMLLTYMEMLCENKKLPLPSCPLNAPVCARACACVYVHAWVYVFFAFVPAVCTQILCSEGIARFDVLNAGNCWYPY